MIFGIAVGRAAILFIASFVLVAVLIFGIFLPGRTGTPKSDDVLIGQISSKTDKGRAAAALSCAALGDERLVTPAIRAFREMKEYKGDMILAIGTLGPKRIKPENLPPAREFLLSILEGVTPALQEKRLALWAAGNLKEEAALPYIEGMLAGVADIATLCVGIETMGQIGSPSSSSKLTAALYRFNKEAICPKTTYTDHAGREVVLSSEGNIALKLLHALADLKDPTVRESLIEMSKDASFPQDARTEAGRIAASMK